MKAWDIWSYQPAGWPEPHPAIIISDPKRVASKPDVNVLVCASKQANRAAEPHEIILDAADGLSWPTLCKCDLIHLVTKAQLSHHRGHVSPERRRQIIQTINRTNDWIE